MIEVGSVRLHEAWEVVQTCTVTQDILCSCVSHPPLRHSDDVADLRRQHCCERGLLIDSRNRHQMSRSYIPGTLTQANMRRASASATCRVQRHRILTLPMYLAWFDGAASQGAVRGRCPDPRGPRFSIYPAAHTVDASDYARRKNMFLVGRAGHDAHHPGESLIQQGRDAASIQTARVSAWDPQAVQNRRRIDGSTRSSSVSSGASAFSRRQPFRIAYHFPVTCCGYYPTGSTSSGCIYHGNTAITA